MPTFTYVVRVKDVAHLNMEPIPSFYSVNVFKVLFKRFLSIAA